MSKGYISSPLNYTGGKYKLLPQILPLFPEKINTFVDIFCGGANVGVNVNAGKVICNDNLTYLIDLYNCFLSQPVNDTIAHIGARIKEYALSLTNQNGYLCLRQEYNKSRNPLDLFVLIAFSFNHQIRFNSSHCFNSPFGRNRSHYNNGMEQNLIRFVNAIQTKKIEFSSLDFDNFDYSQLQSGDLVYADPPYLITTGTYNDGKRGFTGWNSDMEETLLARLSQLDKKEVKFALSNVLQHKGKSNDILIKWIEKNGYKVNYLNKDYSNCNYHTLNRDKNSSVEVLVTNYNLKTAICDEIHWQ